MKGPFPTKEEVLDELLKRDSINRELIEQEKQKKEEEKNNRVEIRLQNHRSGLEEPMSDEELLKAKKKLDKYEKVYA